VKLFISYSRADAKDTANAIHEYLTKYGHHEVFIDTSNIPYGGDWNKVIQKEIYNCDIFITIITPSALYQSEVEKEVELAKNLKKKIIPCIAKDYVDENEIKWELNKYQGFFYERDAKLAMDLHKMLKYEAKNLKLFDEVKTGIKIDDHPIISKKQHFKENALTNLQKKRNQSGSRSNQPKRFKSILSDNNIGNNNDLLQKEFLIFISYAREDEDKAKRLYNDLVNSGLPIKPWMDKEDILPGQDFDSEIKKAIKQSTFFIPLFSSVSVEKRGYIQREFRRAVDTLQEIPPGDIFVIPVRLDKCEIQYDELQRYNYQDLFPSWYTGLERILKSMQISIEKKVNKDNNNLSNNNNNQNWQIQEDIDQLLIKQKDSITSNEESEEIYSKCNLLKKKFYESIIRDDSILIADFINEDFIPLLQELMTSKFLTNIKDELKQITLVLRSLSNELSKEDDEDHLLKAKIITKQKLDTLDETIRNRSVKTMESKDSLKTYKPTKLLISPEKPVIIEKPFYEQKGQIIFINQEIDRRNYSFAANGTMKGNISIKNSGTYWVDYHKYGQGKGIIETKGSIVNYIFQVRIKDYKKGKKDNKVFIGSCIYEEDSGNHKLTFLNGIMSIFKGEADKIGNFETQEWEVKNNIRERD
jgi:hypothetical protein